MGNYLFYKINTLKVTSLESECWLSSKECLISNHGDQNLDTTIEAWHPANACSSGPRAMETEGSLGSVGFQTNWEKYRDVSFRVQRTLSELNCHRVIEGDTWYHAQWYPPHTQSFFFKSARVWPPLSSSTPHCCPWCLWWIIFPKKFWTLQYEESKMDPEIAISLGLLDSVLPRKNSWKVREIQVIPYSQASLLASLLPFL